MRREKKFGLWVILQKIAYFSIIKMKCLTHLFSTGLVQDHILDILNKLKPYTAPPPSFARVLIGKLFDSILTAYILYPNALAEVI